MLYIFFIVGKVFFMIDFFPPSLSTMKYKANVYGSTRYFLSAFTHLFTQFWAIWVEFESQFHTLVTYWSWKSAYKGVWEAISLSLNCYHFKRCSKITFFFRNAWNGLKSAVLINFLKTPKKYTTHFKMSFTCLLLKLIIFCCSLTMREIDKKKDFFQLEKLKNARKQNDDKRHDEMC